MHLCIYGIVKVEYYSYNKGEYFVSVGCIITLIPPKCVKNREPKDEQCVLSVHSISTMTKYIHDTIPLDKLK